MTTATLQHARLTRTRKTPTPPPPRSPLGLESKAAIEIAAPQSQRTRLNVNLARIARVRAAIIAGEYDDLVRLEAALDRMIDAAIAEG